MENHLATHLRTASLLCIITHLVNNRLHSAIQTTQQLKDSYSCQEGYFHGKVKITGILILYNSIKLSAVKKKKNCRD